MATVTGNTVGGSPAGSVDFFVCGPVPAAGPCTSVSSPEGTPPTAPGAGATATATSAGYTPTGAGLYCFAAVYVPTGSGNYTGSADNATGAGDPQACVTLSSFRGITSADSFVATVGSPFTFTVTGAGPPTPSLKKTGKLPGGVTLVDNHNGTATLSGTPGAKRGGVYTPTLTATFKIGKTKQLVTQAFALTVLQAPAVTSHTKATAFVGRPFAFTVKTSGYPLPSAVSEAGTLPSGIAYTDNGNGTATIGGVPAVGTKGIYVVTLTTLNGVGGPVNQLFTLTVKT